MKRFAEAASLRIPALVAVAAVAIASVAGAEDTARKTNEVLSSVAGIARNLELADVPSPIDISADRLEFHYGEGLLRYDGNVTVDHAGAKIRARSLEVSFDPEGARSLKKITARGSVEVLRADESAHGEVAEYDPTAGTIVLTQNARLGSGPNSVSGEKVVIYLNEKRAVVLGGGGAAAAAAAQAAGQAGGQASTPPPSGRIHAVFLPGSVGNKNKPAMSAPGAKAAAGAGGAKAAAAPGAAPAAKGEAAK